MSIPLCAIGDAVLEVIGLNPQGFEYRSEANWPSQAVFDDDPFFQATGMGERVITLRLAARPNVMGGLDQYAILKEHHEAQDVVGYIRLAAGYVGEIGGEVGIRRLGHTEEKIAPNGVGHRHEFSIELVLLGRRSGGLFG
ncbi:phage tail protein [Methylobacterium iners]|uniref:Tail terminator n=1 Tax=Methylobacterium iners TaxID=418707 RepID=A0ABQ4S7V5_9HYPH|nr:phage tail protein [Methylobacterium iners]GJD97878.1 hypothetical protein OCOJLMKI_5117 [Methylobacterium iners]